MMSERREQLLQRIHERTDALLERTASTIQEAIEQYLERELEPPKPRPPPPSS